MRIKIYFLIIIFVIFSCSKSNKTYEYNSLSFGENIPTNKPQVFSSGFISTEKNELNAVFSPDGKEFYYSIAQGDFENIYVTKQINGQWTKSELAVFSNKFKDADPFFSTDGKRLYFISKRPIEKNSIKSKDWDIWYVEKENDRWSIPINLGYPINSSDDELYVSLTKDQTIYFASNRNGGFGSFDIYRSELKDESYAEPINLGMNINSEYLEQDPFIAQDESFLLFTSIDRPEGFGSADIYISYQTVNEEWSKAKNLGGMINTNYFEYCPIISPDQKCFFYTSKGDIYWIDAGFFTNISRLVH